MFGNPRHSIITEARFISLVSCTGKPHGALYSIRTLVVVVAEVTARDWAEEGAVVVRCLVR